MCEIQGFSSINFLVSLFIFPTENDETGAIITVSNTEKMKSYSVIIRLTSFGNTPHTYFTSKTML